MAASRWWRLQRIGNTLFSSQFVYWTFSLVLALAAYCTSASPGQDGAAQTPVNHPRDARPNIILVLFDDVGYSDMSALGGEIHTPTVDQVAREGTIVDRFYTTPWCSPTRAGILSGRYPHDVDMADLGNPPMRTDLPGYRGQLPLDIPLVSELLHEAGYVTYLQGKWHLGDLPGEKAGSASLAAPNGRGFDQFFGFLHNEAAPYPEAAARRPARNPYQHNGQALEVGEDWFAIEGLNTLMLEQLAQQLASGDDAPLFLYLPTQAVHRPLQAPAELVDKYRAVYEQPLDALRRDRVQALRQKGLYPADAPAWTPGFSDKTAEHIALEAATRAAMLEAFDTELGKLLRLLDEYGELDNTFIMIASDNGAHPWETGLTNAPLRGAKGALYEGGVRSPLLVAWPAGGVGEGIVVSAMTTYLDVMPTLLQVAGVSYPTRWRDNPDLPPLEGRSLLPLLRGARLPPPEYFFWDIRGNYAVLYKGRWKLLTDSKYDTDKARRGVAPTRALFDVVNDPGETRNVLPGETALAASLQKSYESWAARHGVIPYYEVLDARAARAGGKKSRRERLLAPVSR